MFVDNTVDGGKFANYFIICVFQILFFQHHVPPDPPNVNVGPIQKQILPWNKVCQLRTIPRTNSTLILGGAGGDRADGVSQSVNQ